jgi:octaprenyl-diphosphate synthase
MAAAYHFKHPGKSFRALLAISSGAALGLDELDNLHWGAACELLHNASLIHDDISDASMFRRGQKSIPAQFGSDIALCLGDWMIAKAFELAARNRTHGGALVALLATAMQETCAGQSSDISQRRCVEVTQWARIAKGKTAPLIIAPIKGAAIATALDSEFNAMESLEMLVAFCALAYQGRNDVDDIIPSNHCSSDLVGRKPNLVVSLYADHVCDQALFNSWYESGDNSSVAQWQRKIASSGVILQANQKIHVWLEEAVQLVGSTPPELRSVASQLISFVKDSPPLSVEPTSSDLKHMCFK